MSEANETDPKQFIQENQEKIADILVKSFRHGKGKYGGQIEYWKRAKKETGIDILDFTALELMENEFVRSALTAAFLQKHKGRFLTSDKTPEETARAELAKAMFEATKPERNL